MATDDDDAATLRERVRELEQTVAQQQDTIQQLMPSRRAVLAGGAGLVGGAALTGQASAQSAAGQVGTSSEPVDVEAASVTADSVNTEKVSTTINRDTNQTIPSGSSTPVQFDNTVEDNLGGSDLANNQVQVPVDGKYLLVASAFWESDANWSTGDRAELEQLQVNGQQIIQGRNGIKVGTDFQSTLYVIAVKTLTSGDAVSVTVRQNSGVDQDIVGNGSGQLNRLSVTKIG